MKRSAVLILMVLLSLSGLSFGATSALTTIPADVTGQIQVIKSGLVYNRTTKTFNASLTLKNTSQAAVYGPITISAIVSDPTNIGLANSAGLSSAGFPSITVSPPNGVLNPSGTINNVVLSFNNPKQETFTYNLDLNAAIDPAAQGTAVINGISPTRSPTGTIVTINGTGFTSASQVYMGNKKLFNPEIVSDTIISFIVPFDANPQGQLIPLAQGVYTIKVDNSISYNFTVTSLPANSKPAGQTINTVVTTLQQSFTTWMPEFQSAINQLSLLNPDPATQQIINQLTGLLNATNNALSKDLPNLVSLIDPVSLDTLERAFLVNHMDTLSAKVVSHALDNGGNLKLIATNTIERQKSVQSKLSQALISSITTALFGRYAYADNACSTADANKWLECRQNSGLLNYDLYNKIASLLSKTCSAVAISNPSLVTVCASFTMLTSVSQITIANMLAVYGTVKSFDISSGGNVSVLCNDENLYADYQCKSLSIAKKLLVNISNIDTLFTNTSPAIAYYKTPTITITHNISLLKEASDIWTSESSLIQLIQSNAPNIVPNSSAILSVASNIQQIAQQYKGQLLNGPLDEGPLSIELNKVDFTNCYLPLTGSGNKNTYWFTADTSGSLLYPKVVTTPWPVTPTNTYSPLKCKINLQQSYLASSTIEYPKSVESDYIIAVYTPITVNITGSGHVTSTPTESKLPFIYDNEPNTPPINCDSTVSCTSQTGYFAYGNGGPGGNVKKVALTAEPSTGFTFTGWSGQDVKKCTIDQQTPQTCTLTHLQGTLLDITATFTAKLTVNAVSIDGGIGTVTSDPSGISCKTGNTNGCTDNQFLDGTIVTLTAKPDANSLFSGWSGPDAGACAGSTSANCYFTMDGNPKNITATFNNNAHWEGSATINENTCTPLPSPAYEGSWIWENPCYSMLPVNGQQTNFYFTDGEQDVIFENSLVVDHDFRIIKQLSWISTSSALSVSIPTAFGEYVTGGFMSGTGERQYTFIVTDRTASTISGTFTVTMTSGYSATNAWYDEYKYWTTLTTTASGLWHASLVPGAGPQTMMNGYDYCRDDNLGIMQMKLDSSNNYIEPGSENVTATEGKCQYN